MHLGLEWFVQKIHLYNKSKTTNHIYFSREHFVSCLYSIMPYEQNSNLEQIVIFLTNNSSALWYNRWCKWHNLLRIETCNLSFWCNSILVNFMAYIGVVNIESFGAKVTWCKNIAYSNIIYQRLERTFVSPNYISSLSKAIVFNLPKFTSNNNIVILHTLVYGIYTGESLSNSCIYGLETKLVCNSSMHIGKLDRTHKVLISIRISLTYLNSLHLGSKISFDTFIKS